MMFHKTNKISTTEGFSLVEMLIYTALLGLILSVILGSLLVIAESQERVLASRSLDRSAVMSLDRVVREVRLSDSIDADASEFEESTGVLVLENDDVSGPISFFINNGSFFVEKEGQEQRLSHSGVDVTRFYLTHISTDASEGVRIELEMSYTHDEGVVEQTFYSTATSRGSYND